MTTPKPSAEAMRAADAILRHAQEAMGDRSRTVDDISGNMASLIDAEFSALRAEIAEAKRLLAAIMTEIDYCDKNAKCVEVDRVCVLQARAFLAR